MKIVNSTISVTIRKVGFHKWPNPTPNRSYLGERHRHQFIVTATMPAAVDDDRQVEFHDLMDEMNTWLGDGEFEDSSCETIACELARQLVSVYKRNVTVSVSEDGEAAATVEVSE